MRKLIVPPGGFFGWSQQTPAVQALLSRGSTTRRKTPARRKKRATPAKRRRTPARRRKVARKRTRSGKKPAYMVKGSAAAKRHMAKLRKMRRG